MGRCNNTIGEPVVLGYAKSMRVCAAACKHNTGGDCTYFQFNDADDSFVCSSVKFSDESCPKKQSDPPSITSRWVLDTHW